ncbi:Facilitated trehalose transporter Tret1 [Chamberlinius hualienensis]
MAISIFTKSSKYHITDFTSKQPNSIRPTLCSLIVAIPSLLLGAGITYPTVAIPDVNSRNETFTIDEFQASWISSLQFLAGIPGACLSGWLMDYYGRKISLMIGSIPQMAGWIFIANAKNVDMIYTGRILCGFSASLLTGISGSYIAEISPAGTRGKLLSLNSLYFNIGTLVVDFSGVFISWRWLAITCAASMTVMDCLLIFISETPRWLILNKNKEKAIEVLRWLKGGNYDVSKEIEDIEECIRTTTDSTTLKYYFKSPMLKYSLASMFLFNLQEITSLTGIRQNTLNTFMSTETSLDPYILTILVGVLFVIGSTLFTTSVEKQKRRVFLLTSIFAITTSLLVLGLYFLFEERNTIFFETYLYWLPITMIGIVCVGHSFGLGPLPRTICNETFANRARGQANSLGTIINVISGFVFTKLYVHVRVAWGNSGPFFISSGICLFGFIISYLTVPETKGQKLESIQKEIANQTNNKNPK